MYASTQLLNIINFEQVERYTPLVNLYLLLAIKKEVNFVWFAMNTDQISLNIILVLRRKTLIPLTVDKLKFGTPDHKCCKAKQFPGDHYFQKAEKSSLAGAFSQVSRSIQSFLKSLSSKMKTWIKVTDITAF